MTHSITALVGEAALIKSLAGGRRLNRPAKLPGGLALMPLPDRETETAFVLPPANDGDEFRFLTPTLIERLCAASKEGRFAYLETEYFGGSGGQGAAVFEDGLLTHGPEWRPIGPINEALKRLGVRLKPPAFDEFEMVELWRFRTTEDWLGL